jgi:hypothetical protein
MLRKARSGYVTGGKAYGYDNIDVHGDARGIDGERQRLHVVRRINQGEALVVRRLFERYASGSYRLRALTKELNAEGILPPTIIGRAGRLRASGKSCIVSCTEAS